MNLSSASCMTGAKPLHIQIRLRVTDGDISLFAGTVPVNVRSLPTTSPTSLCPSVRRPLVLCAEDETFYRTNESGTRQRDRLECTWDSQLPALLLTATAPRWITYRAPNSLSLSSSSLSLALCPIFTLTSPSRTSRRCQRPAAHRRRRRRGWQENADVVEGTTTHPPHSRRPTVHAVPPGSVHSRPLLRRRRRNNGGRAQLCPRQFEGARMAQPPANWPMDCWDRTTVVFQEIWASQTAPANWMTACVKIRRYYKWNKSETRECDRPSVSAGERLCPSNCDDLLADIASLQAYQRIIATTATNSSSSWFNKAG